MPNIDVRFADWIRCHNGTISTRSLEAAGLTRSQVRRLVEARVLERIVDGAYRFVGTGDDELGRCAALCLARPQVVIGGPTAGRIWQFPGAPRDEVVHLVAPPGSQPCRQPWVQVHRTAALQADEIVKRRDGIRLTSPPRTAIDLARFLDDAEVAAIVEFLLRRRICTTDTLRRLAQRLHSPRRPWVRRFLATLDDRLPGRPRESAWEQRVLEALVAREVHDLESQVRERVPGYGAARFDFAIPAIRWVLEVDVHPDHRTSAGQSRDHRRDRSAKRLGWDTARVGEAELRTQFDATMDDVAASVAARRAEVAALIAVGLWSPTGLR